jgi:hypothetical protein
VVHLVLHVLARGVAGNRDLSDRVADSSAVSHRGHRRAWSPLVFEIPLFPSRSIIAGAENNLTQFRLLILK